MELPSKLVEDGQYLIEVALGHAARGVIFNETFRRNRSIIAFPGVAGAWLNDGIKKYMQTNPVSGELVTWGLFTDGIEHKKYFSKIDKIVGKYPNSTILAYSAAGFSLILWAERNQAWDKFNTIITIGTPFRGVQAIQDLTLWCQTFKDIVPSSPLIERVKKIKPPKGKVISIFGLGDEHTPNPGDLELNWPTVVLVLKVMETFKIIRLRSQIYSMQNWDWLVRKKLSSLLEY